MNAYVAMKKRHQDELSAFPLFFAFNKQQFEEGMKKLGLKPTDTDKIYKLGRTGGFYRKVDSPDLHAMFARQAQEEHEAIAADETGNGFIYDMFNYELGNHEYGYTRDPEPTLDAVGLTMEVIQSTPALLHGWKKAEKNQRKNY